MAFVHAQRLKKRMDVQIGQRRREILDALTIIYAAVSLSSFRMNEAIESQTTVWIGSNGRINSCPT